MSLFSFFSRKIKVNDEHLSRTVFYLYPQRKTKSVKLNRELELYPNQICVFVHKKHAYDAFTSPNTYQLNANSLPALFKGAGYNKPNSKGKLRTKYAFRIYFTNTLGKYCHVEINRFSFKDYFYGRQKANFYFHINFNFSDARKFLSEVISQTGKEPTNANINKVISIFFAKHIKKYISKQNFSLGDALHYTTMVDNELTKHLSEKLSSCGICDLSVTIGDIEMKEDLERDIVFNKKLPSYMQKEVDKNDKKRPFSITYDGVPMNVTYDVPKHFSHNSLAQKYSLRGIGIINKKDDSEYTITTLAGAVDENGKPIDKKTIQNGKYCLYCNKLIPTDSVYCPYCRKEQ